MIQERIYLVLICDICNFETKIELHGNQILIPVGWIKYKERDVCPECRRKL